MDFKTLNLLWRCNKEFSHEKIRLQGISDTECMICSFIYSHENCSQDDVASQLKIDKTTVGKALTKLEKDNYVERTQDKADKRVKRLRITKYGYDKISTIMNIHNEWLSEVLTVLSPEEQKQFENYCKRMLTKAEELTISNTNEGEN